MHRERAHAVRLANEVQLVASVAPVAYLTRWSLALAQKALRSRDVSLRELAQQLGYGSESAFCTAFKRTSGQTPRACHAKNRSGGIPAAGYGS